MVVVEVVRSGVCTGGGVGGGGVGGGGVTGGWGVAGLTGGVVGPGAVQSLDAHLHVLAASSVYLEQTMMVLVTFCAHGPRPRVHCRHLKPGASVDAGGDGGFCLVAVLLRVVHIGMVVVVVMIGGVGRGGGGVGPGPGGGVGLGPGPGGGVGPGPVSRQCSVVPPGHPGALSTSSSRVVAELARTPYGGALKLPWSMGLFLAIAHVMTQDPWFLPASASFHSDRYNGPFEGLGYVRVER